MFIIFREWLYDCVNNLTLQTNIFNFVLIGKNNSLKNTNSSGFDNISNKAIKHIKHLLLEPPTLIINQSLMTSFFPDNLKDDHLGFTNYIPISLLPFISKIFEKIIHKQLLDYFTDSKLLSHCQYGFRPRISTEHTASHSHNNIMQKLDSNNTLF